MSGLLNPSATFIIVEYWLSLLAISWHTLALEQRPKGGEETRLSQHPLHWPLSWPSELPDWIPWALFKYCVINFRKKKKKMRSIHHPADFPQRLQRSILTVSLILVRCSEAHHCSRAPHPTVPFHCWVRCTASLHLPLSRGIQPDSQGMLFLSGYMPLIPPSTYQYLKY